MMGEAKSGPKLRRRGLGGTNKKVLVRFLNPNYLLQPGLRGHALFGRDVQRRRSDLDHRRLIAFGPARL